MTAIPLPDGRTLDILVTGPEDGFPFLFHHGTPGAVTQTRAIQRAAYARGLKMITYSRAGYGDSTRLAGRDVSAVSADMTALLDHLGAERCLVGGWSGGGPHALATATMLGERVAGVLVIAGAAPFDAPDLDFLAGMGQQNIDEFGLALRGEDAIRPNHEADRPELISGDVPTLIKEMTTLLPEVDRAVLTDEFGEDTAAGFAEALRLGVDGWVDDDLAFVRPWGFDLADLAVPSFLWQGSEDLMVPFTHGQWLAGHIPGVTAHLEQGEGHLSIGVGALDRMLDELVTSR